MSTILATSFLPEPTTRMSRLPNFSTAAATSLSQLASEFGRIATLSTFAPSASHSAATFFNSSALPAAITTLAPAPASTFAASAPNAPDAPVTIAVLPRTSNRERGFFRKASDMTVSPLTSPARGRGRRVSAPGEGTFLDPEACGSPHPAPSQPRLRWLRKLASAARHPLPLRRGREGTSLPRRQHRHQNGADIVATVDDLAVLVRANVAAIVRLQHMLLAVDDHGEFA